MLKFLQKMLLIAALCVPWVTQSQECTQTVTATTPYFEGFENYNASTSYSTAGVLPTCWDGYTNGTSANYMPHIVTGSGSYCYQRSGSNSLVMTSGGSTYGNTKYVLLPPMSAPLNQLMLTFWMCTESGTNGVLTVGYVTSDDTSTFTEIQSYPASTVTAHSGNGLQATAGLEVELVLSQVPDTATRLAFKWFYGSSFYSCCIDDITVGFQPTCPRVDNISVAPSDDEAMVSWTEMGDATDWEITVTGTANQLVFSDIVSTNPYTVTGLDAITQYNLTIRAVCDAGDTSQPRSSTFRTLCEAISTDDLPYTYSFEDATGTGGPSSFNDCFGRHSNSSTAYPYPYSTYSHDGNYCAYFYSASAYYSYLTLPLFEDDLDDLYLTFWAYKTSANYGHVYVGVMSDPDDLSTFDTIAMLQVNTLSNWELFEVPLSSYTGTGRILALLSPSLSAASYVYIDDITVGLPPACPTPDNIAGSNITARTVDLSWNSNAGEFIVEYGLSGFALGTGDSLLTSTPYTTLTGLTMGTNYTAYVTAICGDDTSNAAYGSFTTGCANITDDDLPYTEDFEAYGTGSASPINACWNKGTVVLTGTMSTNYPYPYSTAAINGNRGLYFYAATTTTASYYNWLALPQIDESLNVSDLMVNFKMKRTATSTHQTVLVVGVSSDITSEAAFIPVDTINLSSEATSSIHDIEVSFANYTDTGRYILFYAPAPATSTLYNAFYVDDITLRNIPSCYWPTTVEVVNYGTEDVELSWTPDPRTPNPNSWTIEYGVHGFTRGEGNFESTTDTTITLTGLLPNTEYDVYVSADCGGDESDPTLLTFRTLCELLEELPYVQDFENAEVGGTTSRSFVNCMFRLNNASQYFGHPYVGATAAYNHTPNGAKGLYWGDVVTAGTYGDYQIVVLPGVNTDNYPINTLQLRFWARATSTSYTPTFQVGVMTNPYDASTFEQVASVYVGGNTTYSEFTTALGNYEGEGQYVAIRALRPTSTWYATIDDIVLEEMPSCPPVVNITANTAISSAMLSWGYQSGYDAPESYEVVYGTVDGEDNTTITTFDPYITLTDLDPATAYKAYIYADCGSDGYGAMDSITFSTTSLGCLELDPTSIDTVLFSNSTTGQSGCLAYSSYGNTVYQAIWTADELTQAGLTAGPITGIDLGFTASSSYDKEFTIFIGHTTTSSISNATIEDPNNQTQVYGPAAHPEGTSGWQHYEFTEGFVWDGVNNIIITTFMNQPTGTTQSSSSGLTGYYVSAANTARYRYKDNSPFTLSDYNSGSSGANYTYRAAIHFHTGDCMTEATCAAPSLSITDVTTTTVDVAWIPGYNEDEWDVSYRVTGAENWTTAATGVSNTSYTFTNLTPATSYDLRVSFVCATDNNYVYESVVNTTTLCAAASLPYTENFDNLTTGTATSSLTVMPPCWDFTLTGTSTYQGTTYYPGVYYSSTYAASGNYCLRLYGVGIFELPEMSAPLDSLRISFSDTTTSANYGLVVGVMEDGVFVPVDTANIATNTRNMVEVSFHSYTGTSRTIALFSYNTSGNTYSYHYIDDLTVDYIPECTHPENLAVVEALDNALTVSWVPVGQELTWSVSCDGNTFIAYDTFYTFNGLLSNTNYTIEVRSICGVGDTSEAIVLTTRTECGALTTLPFEETFESYSTGSSTNAEFVPCWTRLNNGTTYFGYPYIGAATYNHTAGGNRGLYWSNSTTAGTYGDYQYIILPRIDTTALPINTLQLSFWARPSSTSYNPILEVGVMNNNTDTAFHTISTIQVGNSTDWGHFVTNLNTYTGFGGQYIAIRALRSTGSWYAYVDDITLDVIPACPRVEDVAGINISVNGATIVWSDTSSTNTGWNVEYDTLPFTPGTGHVTPVHVTDTSCTITGLEMGMLYHVYVYPDCNNDVFARHYTFTTLASLPATVPYSCNFEANGTNGWDLINGSQTNHWMVGDSTSNGGNRSLYITNDDANNAYTVSSISYVFATRTFNLAAGNYVCTFDWKSGGESSYDFIRAALVPANTELTAGSYCGFDNASAMPTGGIALDGGYRLNLSTSWQTQISEFEITSPDTYKMVFMWRNDGSGGTQPPAAIDNVNLTINSCPIVADLNAITGTNSMDITWTAGGSETSWEVSVNGTTAVVNTPAYTVTGLQSDTTYTVSVRAICGAGDTSMALSENFRTTCAAVTLPYSENFDSYTTSTTAVTGVSVPCWNAIMTGSSTYQTGTYQPQIYYSSTYANSGSYSYRLYGNSYLALPPMPTDLTELQLTFSHYTTGSGYLLEVGVMEGNNFIPVQTINSSTSIHTQQTVYFGDYTGTSRIIAFKNYNSTATTYYSYHYIDDVTVDYLPNCPPVVGVEATAASVDNITIDWIDQAESTLYWDVRYGVNGESTTTTLTASSHPFTITDLDTLTSYAIQVRPHCSATDSGEWSTVVLLSTELCNNPTIATTGPATMTANLGPVNNYYKHTLTETIIDSAELAGIGEISAIAYSYAYATATIKKTDVNIWLQPTDKTEFSSGTDIVAVNPATAVKVYHGNLNCQQGWNYFAFDTVYNWSGQGNLLVIVQDNSGQYDGTNYHFNLSASTEYKTLAYYADGTDTISAYNPSTFTGSNKNRYQRRPTMKLVSCSAGCPKPSNILFDNITYGSASASWSGTAETYEVAYKAATDAVWPEATTVTTNSYNLYNLTPASTYQLRVRALCNVEEDLVSDWTVGTFVTDSLPCFTPTNLTVTPSYSTATFSWQTEGNETSWNIHVWNTAFDSTYTVNTNPATVAGLNDGMTYYASVNANCSTEIVSDYSDTVNFTTESCAPVSGVAVSNITPVSALVTWTGSATTYEVQCVLHGYGVGQGTQAFVQTTQHTLSGLDSETEYDVYVRAVCETGVNSQWSQVVTFTTTAGQVTTYTITATANDATMGTVSGGGTYPVGTDVTLTAIANPGYNFVNWNDGVTTSTRTITVTGDASYVANFEAIPTYTITVSANNPDWGTVTGGGTFEVNTTTTITASANAGYMFASWDDGNTEAVRTITVTADHDYVATFVPEGTELNYYDVTVTANDPAMGTVTGGGTHIVEGSVITLTATANAGYRFVDWSDGVTDNPRQITVNEDITLTANFEALPTYTITVNSNNENWGMVTGGGTYPEGTEVTISATAFQGYEFVKWNDNVTTPTRVITVTADATYTATFQASQIGIAEAEGMMNVSVYPNPATSTTTVALSGVSGDVTITVVDMNGRVVKSDAMSCDGSCTKLMKVGELAQGAYFIRVSGENVNMVKKLIVK